jgi:hypothetical protein
MKKFTTNFSGEGYRSSLRILRSIALGLVALVWANTAAFAQTCPPPDSTVYFYADDVTACYSANNLYKVKVSVMDFDKLDSLHLVLNYNSSFWTFVSATVLEDNFKQTNSGPGGTNQPMSIVGGGGTVTFDWAELVSRGHIDASMGAQSEFAELVFSLNNFPNNSLPVYQTDLEWNLAQTKVYHCDGGSNWEEWNGADYTDGSITTTVKYPTVEFTIDPDTLDCVNQMADVVITSPVGAGYAYTFNGSATWSDDPTASASVGVHVLQVRDADGCLSNDSTFEVYAQPELAYTIDVTDESCSNLGAIQFHVTGGVAPYTYWVVPADEFSDVMFQMGLDNGGKNDPTLAKYKFTQSTNLRPAGDYVVAVDDVNECVVLEDGFGHPTGAWTDVEILPGADFVFTDEVINDTVTCHNAADGVYAVTSITGDSTFYYITIVDGTGATVYTKDSVTAVGDTISGLGAGEYEVSVSDGVCAKFSSFTISNVDDPTFYLDYTDAPCTAGTGTLWITEINGESIVGTTVDTTGWQFRVEGPGFNQTVSISDTMTGIPANYYEVYLITNCPTEIPFDNVDGTGNTVPIMEDGAITFNLDIKNETCFGDNDGYIRVIDVARDCDNCNDDAVYQFRVDSANWMAIVDTFFATTQDTYLVEVRDSADPDVCIVGKNAIVSGPDSALAIVIDSIYAPTCKGGNDGWVKMRVTGGTIPYSYSVDNAPNWRPNMSFGLTEGDHLLQVRDANGCMWDSTITVETLSPILITATLMDTISCSGDRPTIDVDLDTFTWYSDSTVYDYYYSEISGAGFAGNEFTPDFGTTPTTFAAGTYYIKAQDPNGCWSNEDTVVIEDVLPLETAFTSEDATCYGTWTGRVNLTVLHGSPDSVYYYAYANNPDYLNNPNANINWYPFNVGDTSVSIEMLKGEYWFQIKDGCEESNPFEVYIDGYDPIEITSVVVENVGCYGDNDGTITVNAIGGAPGAGVGNYLYTLTQDGTVIGMEKQPSNVFTKLYATHTAGSSYDDPYVVYVYDSTDPNATPAMCTPASQDVNVNQPYGLYADIDLEHVTCADAEDGVISVYIQGGVGGRYNYAGNNSGAATDGKAYKVTINGITGDRDFSMELADDQNEVDFQVYGGDFEVVVEDANGCMFIDTVTVHEPEPWVINTWTVDPSDCNIADGEIWATATGGFVDPKNWIKFKLDGVTVGFADQGDTIQLSDQAVYGVDYVVTVTNEHSIKGQCVGVDTVTIEVFNPFEFDVDVECVKCYGGSDGKVTISNITGGSGKYQIQLVGGDNPTYDPNDDDLWWPVDADGDPLYVNTDVVFDTLSVGDYWIYLRDDAGFTLANCCRPIKFEMCQPDSLELNTVTWVKDVECAGDSTGAFSIQASGGTAPYQYTYSRTEVGNGGHPYPTLPDNPVWYTDSIITGVPAGTYIGWVMDANGCVTGCEIDANGFPIDDHRVVIREADALTFGLHGVKGDVCYGEVTQLVVYNVQGGSGATFTAEVTGTTYDGMDTTYVFADLDMNGGHHYLPVYASNADGYAVSLITEAGCRSASDTIVITQLDEFMVDIDVTSGAVCEGDQEVLIVMNTTGGSGDVVFDIYSDGVLIRENSDIPNHVVAVGHEYVVVAKDWAGCTATDTMMIEIPQAVVSSIKDISCNGEAKASVRITAQGTPGRSFMATWKEFEGDIITKSDSSAWFDETIDVLQEFIFDSENINDIHYEFIIVDDMGCISAIDTLTFDPVQHPIELYVDVLEQKECTADISLNVTGGIDPYLVVLDGDTLTDLTIELSSGTHDVVVTDTHLRCKLETTIDVDSNPVVRDTTIETYIGEKVQFVDVEAGLDTMLTQGDYTFTYGGDTVIACVRTLNVTVNEIPRQYAIAEVQGTDNVSPIDGQIAQIEGTVTAVADGEGFFVQDANAAWSGIWIEYSNVTDDGIQEGNGVVVVGKVAEVANVTTIAATSVTGVAPTLTVAPVDVPAPSDIDAEMYESVVVKVSGARASAADAGTGEWTIKYEDTDVATVNDWLFAYDPTADAYYNVTGVVNGRLDAFKLEPRKASDIVNITDTEIGDLDGVEFKVYPNPFSNVINIENNDKLTRVVISNIAGQRVMDVEYPNSEIRTDNLVSGIYVISLITENGIAKTEKIIKK